LPDIRSDSGCPFLAPPWRKGSLIDSLYWGRAKEVVPHMMSLSLRVVAFVFLSAATTALMALPYLSIQ
jgi:hypothetical protein